MDAFKSAPFLSVITKLVGAENKCLGNENQNHAMHATAINHFILAFSVSFFIREKAEQMYYSPGSLGVKLLFALLP